MDPLSVMTTPSSGAGAPIQGGPGQATDSCVEQVEFGFYLRELCAGLARANARPGGPVLACTAADAVLPVEAAVRLGLAVDELVTNAFVHGFPDGRTGKIWVVFAVGQEAARLTVRDSGVGMWHGSGRPGAGLDVARRLVGEIGGRLELPDVVGGSRCVAVVPRGPSFQPCCTIDAAGGVGPAGPG